MNVITKQFNCQMEEPSQSSILGAKKQADGAAVLRMGNTVLFSNRLCSKGGFREQILCFAVWIIREQYSAAGRFQDSIKREGKSSDNEILTPRLVIKISSAIPF